ncbi:hypothetical protein D3C85_774920 [compost metagenome]
MLGGVRHIHAVIGVGHHVVQHRRQGAIPGTIGVLDLLRAAHVGGDMGVDPRRIAALVAGHGAAELIHVEFGDDAGQQGMGGFALVVFLGVARHVEADGTGGAEHHVGPVQRLVGGTERVFDPGQGLGFVLVHGEHGHVLADEVTPPLGVLVDDETGAQGQHHGHTGLAGITHGSHGRLLHGGAVGAAHQVGGDHQGGGLLDDGLRDVRHVQVIHLAGVDAKAALAPFGDEGEAATDRAIHRLQVVEVDPGGGVAQIAVGVAADADVLAHHPEQDGVGIRQHRVVVHGVAYGAAGKLAHHHVVGLELFIDPLGHIVGDEHGVTLAQAVPVQEVLVHMGFDIHQSLIYAHHIGLAQFGEQRILRDQGITPVDREVVFGLALTGKFHGNLLCSGGKRGGILTQSTPPKSRTIKF